MTISRRSLIQTAGVAAVAAATDSLAGPALAASTNSAGAARARSAVLQDSSDLVLPVNSRDSVFTRGGAGPRYWTVYGWDYPNNAAIPESVWQQNVDWVASTFKPYGYDMCVTDGWIDYTQNTTGNGYILSYQDSWTNTWEYWSQYLQQRGMSLGVYYNPLWVCKSAVEDTSKTVVGRPDVAIADIVDAGDWFGGASSAQQLYWVDVTKDGAREYVQGYVEYFKQLGVAFLRVDFLSWYESGYDQNVGASVGVAHGSANYATALSWMSEAAGDDVMLSLVMPNLFNHGANEILYGDSVRIDDDALTGGWGVLSAGRQDWTDSWSQWHNPFGGFTGFADRSGRGQLCLDGDFLVLNGFASDAEKQTAVTLYTMAGSQLAIADRVDNIGDDAQFYTNTEVLALNAQGLAAKPYFYSNTPFSQDSGSRDTGSWIGQLPDGSWAVALINRGDGPGTTSKGLDLTADLGINGPGTVRDLWAQQDLGTLSALSVDLEPHACQLVRIVPTEQVLRYQAAFAAWGGGAMFNNNHTGYSAMGFVDTLGTAGATVTFAISADQAGSRQVTFRYANATGAASTDTVAVTDEAGNQAASPVQVSFPNLADWDTWGEVTVALEFLAGVNLLTLAYTTADTGAINLNYLEIQP